MFFRLVPISVSQFIRQKNREKVPLFLKIYQNIVERRT